VKSTLVALVVCGAMLAVAMKLSGQQTDRKGRAFSYEELSKAPEKAQKRPNPLENDPDAVAAGGLLFEDHCAECHGDKAQGGRKGPSLLVPEVQKATPGTIFWLLTNGVSWKGMPVWSKLPEPQRWQLVRFLKSLGSKASVPDSDARGSSATKPNNSEK
jgi:mono/diheme cytochrome c family protein